MVEFRTGVVLPGRVEGPIRWGVKFFVGGPVVWQDGGLLPAGGVSVYVPIRLGWGRSNFEIMFTFENDFKIAPGEQQWCLIKIAFE